MKGFGLGLGVLLCAACLFCVPLLAVDTATTWGGSAAGLTAAAPAATQATVAVGAPPVPSAPEAAPVVKVEVENPAGLRKGLSLRQRREMGLTIRNVRKLLVEKQKADGLRGKTIEELSIEVMDTLMVENPKAFADPTIDWDTVDWDTVFEFIVKLIAVVLKIMFLPLEQVAI